MSRSDWGRHVAIIAAAFVALTILCGTLLYTFHMGDLSGRKDAEAQGYASAYPNDTSKQIADCWSNPDAHAAQECVANAIDASHESQRSEQDLLAQRQMSDWAFWALVVASVTAAVTAIGTFMLYQQIVLTREAVTDTGLATLAMQESNKIAANTLKISQEIERGRLEINECKIEVDGSGTTIARISVENIGRTPATIKNGCFYLMDSVPVNSSDTLGIKIFYPGNIIVKSGNPYTILGIDINNCSPIWACWMIYEDIVGKSHNLSFFLQNRGGGIDYVIPEKYFMDRIISDMQMICESGVPKS